MLLDRFIYPAFGDKRIDQISNEDVNAWYDALAPGRETIRAQSYSLLRTVCVSAASERPHPLVLYNPAHIRGAGNTKRAHHVQPATLEELRVIVEELPDRYKLMALLAAWCAMRFGELAELRRGDIDLRTNRVKIRRGSCESTVSSPSATPSAGTTSGTPAPCSPHRRAPRSPSLWGRLGHTTPGAAMRYQHAAADRDAEIARRLSELAGA
jgi:hypothetical protein